ncbi:NAD-binding protein [Streptomyces sp. NPDC088847]|uniref:NAD-binding protein n=1 Tax=Streptomyces sp. NPDC088847 TaxID=3365909 RepID=UPI0038280B02
MPRRITIIGGGYQGLEFASMLSHYDIPVTILESRERILSREDEDVAHAVEQILRDSWITFVTGARVTG